MSVDPIPPSRIVIPRAAGSLADQDQLRRRRLGRALVVLHNSEGLVHEPAVRAELEHLFFGGNAMDFATRLHEHGEVTGAQALEYAKVVGFGTDDLCRRVLPPLKAVGIVDYSFEGDQLLAVEEFVGVRGTVLDQTYALFDSLNPSGVERSTLHSILLGSWAPLAKSTHLQALSRRGFKDQEAEKGLTLSLACGVNQSLHSDELREDVIFGPNVWGSSLVEAAGFLRSLPAAEQEVLLGVAEEIASKPGIALANLGVRDPGILRAAQKVGLVQTATVRSSAGSHSSQTYAFGPLIEVADDTLVTTEALHGRKQLVAHMLFAHEKAISSRGRVFSPVLLMRALIRNGEVGPATNIGTDYHLLEAAGIVEVDESRGDRPYLRLVKHEIAQGALEWLESSFGEQDQASLATLGQLKPPRVFQSPEMERAQLPREAAAHEVTKAAVMALRREAQRATRGELNA
jgi:hypothetical protein